MADGVVIRDMFFRFVAWMERPNRRSFDFVCRKDAANFAQDDRLRANASAVFLKFFTGRREEKAGPSLRLPHLRWGPTALRSG